MAAFAAVLNQVVARHLVALPENQFTRVARTATATKALCLAAPTQRHQALCAVLDITKFFDKLLVRFVETWKSSLLKELVAGVCQAITAGQAVGSIELSVRLHLGHMVEPMVLSFLEFLLNNHAIEAVVHGLSSADAPTADAMYILLLSFIHGIALPSVQSVFTDRIPVLQIRSDPQVQPRLPGYVRLASQLIKVARAVLAGPFAHRRRNVVDVVAHMETVISTDLKPLHNLACVVGQHASLRRAFFEVCTAVRPFRQGGPGSGGG